MTTARAMRTSRHATPMSTRPISNLRINRIRVPIRTGSAVNAPRNYGVIGSMRASRCHRAEDRYDEFRHGEAPDQVTDEVRRDIGPKVRRAGFARAVVAVLTFVNGPASLGGYGADGDTPIGSP
jgi:hypothetical protein